MCEKRYWVYQSRHSHDKSVSNIEANVDVNVYIDVDTDVKAELEVQDGFTKTLLKEC